MNRFIFALVTTLFATPIVQAQTVLTNTNTRSQTIQKGKVLRKKTQDKNLYKTPSGTRGIPVQKGQKIQGSSRTQPMVTKPLAPIQ